MGASVAVRLRQGLRCASIGAAGADADHGLVWESGVGAEVGGGKLNALMNRLNRFQSLVVRVGIFGAFQMTH